MNFFSKFYSPRKLHKILQIYGLNFSYEFSSFYFKILTNIYWSCRNIYFDERVFQKFKEFVIRFQNAQLCTLSKSVGYYFLFVLFLNRMNQTVNFFHKQFNPIKFNLI